jgi:hypothetical protein
MDPGSWGSGLTAAKVPNHNHTYKNHQKPWSMTPIISCWPRWIPRCVGMLPLGMLSGTNSGRSHAAPWPAQLWDEITQSAMVVVACNRDYLVAQRVSVGLY